MSRGRNWLFTENNPTLNPNDFLESAKLWDHVRYIIFQQETGEGGTSHYQGYVEFSQPIRFAKVTGFLPRAHWEMRRGTSAQCIEYCSKLDTRVDGPWTYGDPGFSSQGSRSDLSGAIEALREGGLKRLREDCPEVYVKYHRGLHQLYNAELPSRPRAPDVHLLFGPPGCGKTRFFYDNYPNSPSLAVTDGFWFDGYSGEDSVLIDDYDGKASRWTLSNLLRILDRYSIQVPIKGGFTPWIPTRIFITSNLHPSNWYDYSQRQQRYQALSRRFTRVTWWSSLQDSEDLTPDSPRWEHFWAGPESAQRSLDIDSGRLISRPPDSEFSF
ncbi:replication-associated protein [False black widow spider associated circular virus 1]|uniref:replication-associated protein n=1 Tax=False black widow spider associated circular virus 1 TaxID=2293279 RepID=UPI000E33717F|nr:replication-associated protein [False black widow spider associated circular virus 1]AXL65944.1 replication-associated protein [False black widow spider associated circular virus 1]